MPARRKARRTRRKTKRHKQRVQRGLVPRSGTATYKLRYVDAFRLNPGTTDIPARALWNMAGPYDPDWNNVGHSQHQPKNFDQIATYFEHYNVVSAKATIYAQADSGTQMSVFIHQTEDATPSNQDNFVEMKESERGYGKELRRDQGGFVKLTKTYDRKKEFNDPSITRAIVTSNPTDESSYMRVSAVNTIAGQTPVPVDCVITIDYVIQFSERKDIFQS